MAYYQNPYYGQIPDQQRQVMNGGFVPIPNEAMARNYPVAHGNSVTFKDENAPYVYVKTVGFSQMDVPVFEKYRLIRETDSVADSGQAMQGYTSMPNDQKDEIGALKGQIEGIKKDIKELMDFKAEFGGGDDDE